VVRVVVVLVCVCGGGGGGGGGGRWRSWMRGQGQAVGQIDGSRLTCIIPHTPYHPTRCPQRAILLKPIDCSRRMLMQRSALRCTLQHPARPL